jgi:hypothetical protein
VAVVCGGVVAGCGSSSSSSSTGGGSTSTPASTSSSSTPASTTGSSTSGSSKTSSSSKGSSTSGSGGSSVASNPAVQQAVAACKSAINSAPQLDATDKGKLTNLCNQAATGNVTDVKKVAQQVCDDVVKKSVPASEVQTAEAQCKTIG